MEIFQDMLGVVLGLILVYFVLSLASSFSSQLFMDAREIRGLSLERSLRLIVGDRIKDFLNLPQIKSLRPVKYKSWFAIFGAATEPKKVENIPITILVDSFIDVMDLANTRNRRAPELKKTISKMPDCDAKGAMQLWVAQGIDSLDDLRAKLTIYFTGLLEQASATSNANARSFVINFSIIIVLLLGTDSISLMKDFWYLPTMREALVTQFSNVIEHEPLMNLESLIHETDNLSLSISWLQASRYLPPATPLGWIQFVVLKLLGLTITAIFVSQGSGFWFDILSKLK
jgi:hypothetical protein